MRIRAAVVGIGNRLRGDDAVGCVVIERLAGWNGATLIDAETVPENYIEAVARLEPERIVIVDACDFGAQPGDFRLFDQDEIARLAGGLISTHTVPLHLFIELLSQRTGADIRLLGVQPARLEFNAELSEPVSAALPGLLAFLRRWADEPSLAPAPRQT